METVYAIFDNFDQCVYLCYCCIDEDNEYYEVRENMCDWNWKEWLDA